MRPWSAAASALLLAPSQALALTCALPPEPTRAQLETPAGAAEYHAATSVAVVRFRRTAQPPCFWIKLVRLVKADAYPADTCEPSMRSQRYRLKVVETLKGELADNALARFTGGHPADWTWLSAHRLEAGRSRPHGWDNDPAVEGGERRGHAAFAFRHNGRIASNTLVTRYDACTDEVVPFVTTYEGRAAYLVFQNADGIITHWEMLPGLDDLLLDRMRRLKIGQTDVRERIDAKRFFAALRIVSPYEVKWCDASPRLRPTGGRREGRLERIVRENWRSETCRPGQQFLVLGAGPRASGWSDERQWPSIQLVPVSDGAIRTADIVSQLKIEGPETIPVSQALAWTD